MFHHGLPRGWTTKVAAIVTVDLASAGRWSCARHEWNGLPQKMLNEQRTSFRKRSGTQGAQELEGFSAKERVDVA